ncbi:MAG: outer membrane beta-barrel protein [Gemmatimonadota bacterium]
MRLATRTALLTTLALGMSTAIASAQQWDDSFKWYIGAGAGVLGFETPLQTRSWKPTFGANLLVVAKRTGLIIEVDEAFGSNEKTGYTDATTTTGVREVTFDRIRKYSAILTIYPHRGRTQPYFGLGFGILQAIGGEPGGVFTSQVQANLARDLVSDKSTSGFVTGVGGVQFRLGRVVGFGQYQITSSPSAGKLLSGPTHSLMGGVRFSLGNAREGIKGGGY